MFPQLASDRKAVFAGQPKIEQESGLIDRHQLHQRAIVVHRRDAIAVAAEVVGQHLRDVDFIFEEGDVEGVVHLLGLSSLLMTARGEFLLHIAFPLNAFFDAFDGNDPQHLWERDPSEPWGASISGTSRGAP